MPYAEKIILHAPPSGSPKLEAFVEQCLQDKVVLVCVIGEDCAWVEEAIEEILTGDGSDFTRRLIATSHPGESIDDVRSFAEDWTVDVVDPTLPVQEVRL